MLFPFGTDCNSKAILVSFPSILYQVRMDCKWHGFLIPLIKSLLFNKFTLCIYPLLNDLNSLKTEQSKRKQGLRKSSNKQKGCNYNLLKICIKASPSFPLWASSSIKKFHLTTRGKREEHPCFSASVSTSVSHSRAVFKHSHKALAPLPIERWFYILVLEPGWGYDSSDPRSLADRRPVASEVVHGTPQSFILPAGILDLGALSYPVRTQPPG